MSDQADMGGSPGGGERAREAVPTESDDSGIAEPPDRSGSTEIRQGMPVDEETFAALKRRADVPDRDREADPPDRARDPAEEE